MVAMRPIAVPVMVFSAMFESVLIAMFVSVLIVMTGMFSAIFSAVALAFAFVTNLYEIG